MSRKEVLSQLVSHFVSSFVAVHEQISVPHSNSTGAKVNIPLSAVNDSKAKIEQSVPISYFSGNNLHIPSTSTQVGFNHSSQRPLLGSQASTVMQSAPPHGFNQPT